MAVAAAAPDPPLPGEAVKPFTPEKAKEIVMSLQQPAIFCNMVFDWPVLHWNAKYLSEALDGKTIHFRMGIKKKDTAPQFETKCSYVEATLEEFLAWTCGQPTCFSGPFSFYDSSKYWAYADYKYIARLFEDKTEKFKDIIWSDFGFSGRNGKESTLWIGSAGANTPCHLDSYGCNLVLQIQGRKRWHLFPPGDTTFLYPTRIPYEESSIFSKVNVVNPDLKLFPKFRKAHAHVITLNPGQGSTNCGESYSPAPHRACARPAEICSPRVLFVPRHWWHYVESVDPITVSINSWIELDADHRARVEEAITRTLVCAIKSAENPSHVAAWLNPTEVEATSHETNLQYLNKATSAYLDYQKVTVSEDKDPSTRDIEKVASSCKRRKMQVNTKPKDCKSLTHEAGLTVVKAKKLQKIPFGVHLLPVLPQSQEASAVGAGAVESDFRDLLRENEGRHFGKLHCTGKQSVMNSDYETLADQTESDSTANSSQMAISTDDLLDCLVNPEVISLVAGLLLEREEV